MRRKTHEEFIKDIKEKLPEYKVISEYTTGKDFINIEHNCGYKYSARASEFIRMNRMCPNCSTNTKRKTTEIYKNQVKKLVGEEYEVIGEYIHKKALIKIKHNKCGLSHEYVAEAFLGTKNRTGRRCPHCNGQYRLKDTEFAKQEISLKTNSEYELISPYGGDKSIVEIRHIICNNTFKIRYFDFIRIKYKCPFCRKLHKKDIDIKYFKREVSDLVGNEYSVISDNYEGTHRHIIMKHNVCGYEYPVSRTNFINPSNYRRCPKCSQNGISNLEIELADYIKKIYKGKIILNDKKILNGKELDIYLPQLKIAIEFNGLYWHSEEGSNGRCDRNYHINKTNICRRKGIRLIHIFEDEWKYKQNIVKNKIKHILHVSNKPVIYARKCKVKLISTGLKNSLLEKTHLQGKDNSLIKLGLVTKINNKNIIVAVMTFGKPRIALGQKKSKYDYELVRYSTSNNYRVIGGFGKLFSYFKNNYTWYKLLTYADIRWSEGNVYLKNGWDFSHYSKPSYWYVKNNTEKREYRFKYRKQKLEKLFPDIYSKNKTEKEIMSQAGFIRIWDCGNMVFEYTRK